MKGRKKKQWEKHVEEGYAAFAKSLLIYFQSYLPYYCGWMPYYDEYDNHSNKTTDKK